MYFSWLVLFKVAILIGTYNRNVKFVKLLVNVKNQ